MLNSPGSSERAPCVRGLVFEMHKQRKKEEEEEEGGLQQEEKMP